MFILVFGFMLVRSIRLERNIEFMFIFIVVYRWWEFFNFVNCFYFVDGYVDIVLVFFGGDGSVVVGFF